MNKILKFQFDNLSVIYIHTSSITKFISPEPSKIIIHLFEGETYTLNTNADALVSKIYENDDFEIIKIESSGNDEDDNPAPISPNAYLG